MKSYVLNNIYDPLTRYNTKEGKLEPALATSWSVSDDGLAWTFKLRPGVKFHSGEPVTAKSIKAMLDRNIKMGQGAHYLWGGATVAAPDDMTLVITTKDPLPIDLVSSASYACMVYSADAAAKGTDVFQKGYADGTGPYKLVQWVPNQQIVLERNKDYWRGWKGNEPDRIIVKIVSEVSTQLQMLRSGEADMTFATIPFDMVNTLQQDPNIKIDIVDFLDVRARQDQRRQGADGQSKVPRGADPYHGLRDRLEADLCGSCLGTARADPYGDARCVQT